MDATGSSAVILAAMVTARAVALVAASPDAHICSRPTNRRPRRKGVAHLGERLASLRLWYDLRWRRVQRRVPRSGAL